MTSSKSTLAPRAGNGRVISVDWALLFRRLAARGRQLFTSARYTASQTEYTPPAWFQRFRLTWFRIGLIAIAAFVFTQKQIDFTVSVGKEGLAVGATEGRHMATEEDARTAEGATSTLSLIPGFGNNSSASSKSTAWSAAALDRESVEAYINRFDKVARNEERKYSIPAAANMALAIIHSNAGNSSAAGQKNNHFFPITQNTFYENAWLNWRSHSELINERYPQLAAESVNYQQWIAALARTDYSDDAHLASKIQDVVELYGLDRL